ncbi:MAG: alpha/beta hydrolase [Proteobacteria bacterium]|nr:alpha/beta hydrolase [Pseudomonadota bacterium]
MEQITKNIKIVMIHGNSGTTSNHYWFPSVKTELEALGIKVVANDLPDNTLARASIWLPFMKDELNIDKNTIIIGHSSGAIAAMRYAEKYSIYGSVLVASYYTDLGMESEKNSGYFDSPWDWGTISKNQNWIIQFASTDDPWIPISEPRYVHDKLNSQYHEFTNMGHFGGDYDKKTFPECVDAIKKLVKI